MDPYNLRDWLLKHFNVLIPEKYSNIYFDFDDIMSPDIYEFDTCQSWQYFYNHVICYLYGNCWEPKSNLIVTIQQLFKNDIIWEKLYYVVGKVFFLCLLTDCKIFIKWGCNTFILLSGVKQDICPENKKYLPVTATQSSSIFDDGFDKNIVIKLPKTFHPLHQKSEKSVIPNKTPQSLKSDILKHYVGSVFYSRSAFGKLQLKSLIKLTRCNLKFKDCKAVLDRIVNVKDNIVPPKKIVIFLIEVIRSFIPFKLMFKNKYFNKFLENIQKFMTFNVRQKLTLGCLMNGLALKSDCFKRNTLAKIILWIFDTFVIKILRAFFSVSQNDRGHSLVFVKQHYWSNFQKSSIRKMCRRNQLVEVKKFITTEKLKKIKFLPKTNGFRPIITKSRSDELNKHNTEICNTFLRQLVVSKRGQSPNPCKELHSAWLNFIRSKDNVKQYYAKVDIKDAYGSIIHNQLKDIIERWCDKLGNNLLMASFQFKDLWGKPKTLQQFVSLPSSAGRKILIYKIGKEKVVPLSELKSQIFNFIDNIYFSFGKKNYKLIKGLPQGGKLSAALCEMYYTSFDYSYLSDLCDNRKGELLLRAVDDYIFISSDQDNVYGFLDMMSAGLTAYGVEIQTEKTITNIPQFGGNTITPIIPFFGFLLNVNNGSITPNLEIYKDNMGLRMSFNKLDKNILMQKMSYGLTSKLNKMLIDHGFQSVRTIISNIHLACIVTAMKFIATIDYLNLAKIELDEEYVMSCIEKGIHLVARFVSKRENFVIEYNTAKKIGCKAFILIFKRMKYYPNIIKRLQIIASRLKVRTNRMDRIVKKVGNKLPPSLSHYLKSK